MGASNYNEKSPVAYSRYDVLSVKTKDNLLANHMTIQDKAKSIISTLRASGYESFFAGGCVRDQLLGNSPKDYDIATAATPEQVSQLFKNSDTIGAHFGVMLVKITGDSFEIATFRNDGSYSDGRRPDSVSYTTATEDAIRRDFTINGLFKNPLNGEIVDFVHGKVDLEEKTIRAIGKPEKRFQEDALRLLRAIRFAVKLDFDIEPRTWQAILNNAPLLKKISTERITDEFNKILLHKNRARGIQLLHDSGLLKQFLPEFLALVGCEQPPQFHPEGDVFTHTKIMLNMLGEVDSLELCLAVLLHDIGKPPTYTYDTKAKRIRFNGHDNVGAEMATEILTRMRYPNKVIKNVTDMVANHMNFMNVQQMKIAKVKRFMARETYPLEIELHRVDCLSSNGITENYDFLKAMEKKFSEEPLLPTPLLKGKDLIQQGHQPGPQFKKILKNLQTEQLEGNLKTKEEALLWLKQQ